MTGRLVHQTPSMTNAPRILVVEDHPLFRAALIDVIYMTFPGAEVLQATSIGGALDVVTGGDAIDVILLDLSMPERRVSWAPFASGLPRLGAPL